MDFDIPENGTLQLYTANETADQNVWFDDFKVAFTPQLIVQENHYYPFGLELAGIRKVGKPEHKFTYNGKEKQEEFGLNWLDYGARNYDAALGRWFGSNQKAEKFYPLSPYNFVANVPTMLVDPDGRDWAIKWKEKNGKLFLDIVFFVAVKNSSSKTVDMQKFSSALKNQTKKMFDKKMGNVIVNMAVKVRVLGNNGKAANNETLVEIVDQGHKNKDGQVDIDKNTVGRAVNGKHILINARYAGDIASNKNKKTLPHEIGHTGGLRHPVIWTERTRYLGFFKVGKKLKYNEVKTNFMLQGNSPHLPKKYDAKGKLIPIEFTGVSDKQVRRIYRSGKLNKSTGTHPIDQD